MCSLRIDCLSLSGGGFQPDLACLSTRRGELLEAPKFKIGYKLDVNASDGAPSRTASLPEFRDYLAEAILLRLTAMQGCIEAVRSREDAVAIKAMRVWARRARAALECASDLFPRKESSKIEATLKKTASALGVVRDNDVLVENLQKRNEGLPESQRSGVFEMIEELKRQRSEQKKSALNAVKNLERQNPVERFRSL